MLKCTPSKSYLKLLNEVTENAPINDPINASDNYFYYLIDNEKLILNLLFKKPNITQNELANELNIALKTIKRTMLSMKSKNIIERRGANKNGYWIILND